jgi:hypothetical protein
MSSLFMFVFAYLVPHKLVAVFRIPCGSNLIQLWGGGGNRVFNKSNRNEFASKCQ